MQIRELAWCSGFSIYTIRSVDFRRIAHRFGGNSEILKVSNVCKIGRDTWV